MTKNWHDDLAIDGTVVPGASTTERKTGAGLISRVRGDGCVTLGADEGYDKRAWVAVPREMS